MGAGEYPLLACCARGRSAPTLTDRKRRLGVPQCGSPLLPQDVISELTDSTQFGQRGEAWFAAQVIALLLVAFPPGGLRAPVDAAGWLAVVAGLGLA